MVDLPAFGDGKSNLGPSDILRAILLYRRTLDVLLALSAVLAVMVLLS